MADSDVSPQWDDRHHRRSRSRSPVSPEWTGETPPSWITRRASRCLCSCGSVTPGGERSGAGGRTCRARPGGKGLGGNGLGALVWVWVWLAWLR